MPIFERPHRTKEAYLSSETLTYYCRVCLSGLGLLCMRPTGASHVILQVHASFNFPDFFRDNGMDSVFGVLSWHPRDNLQTLSGTGCVCSEFRKRLRRPSVVDIMQVQLQRHDENVTIGG